MESEKICGRGGGKARQEVSEIVRVSGGGCGEGVVTGDFAMQGTRHTTRTEQQSGRRFLKSRRSIMSPRFSDKKHTGLKGAIHIPVDVSSAGYVRNSCSGGGCTKRGTHKL